MSYEYKLEEYAKRQMEHNEKIIPQAVGSYGKMADKEIEELENTISELKISVKTYGDKMNTAALVVGKLTAENKSLQERLNNE